MFPPLELRRIPPPTPVTAPLLANATGAASSVVSIQRPSPLTVWPALIVPVTIPPESNCWIWSTDVVDAPSRFPVAVVTVVSQVTEFGPAEAVPDTVHAANALLEWPATKAAKDTPARRARL